MAERRMFAKSIIDSDAFLDLPQSTQLLYFHLAMRADDDGFVNNPKRIARAVGCGDDDAKLLLAKQFIISFASGVIVIRHWRLHNYIQKDRYHETAYKDEKASLGIDKNNVYSVLDTGCIHDGYNLDTEVRLGKVSIGKSKVSVGECRGDVDIPPTAEIDRALQNEDEPKSKRFVKPTIEEIKAYCEQENLSIDAEHFFNYYESNGWRVGKNSMKKWKSAVKTWAHNGYSNGTKQRTAEQRQDAESRLAKLKARAI